MEIEGGKKREEKNEETKIKITKYKPMESVALWLGRSKVEKDVG